jgi:hypothetical protein
MRRSWLLALALLFFVLFSVAHGEEFHLGSSMSSENFRILGGQSVSVGGLASSSSSSFRLLGTIGEFLIGSSSATTFGLRQGALYFPVIIAPTLSTASAGNAQVALTWSAAQAVQGLSVSGYNVCVQPAGGSYTCESAGDVLAFTKASLTNGVAYTFKIQAKDAVGNIIAVSNEQSATPAAPASSGGGSSGGGGGGGGGSAAPSSGGTGTISIRGTAYGSSNVSVLLDSVTVSAVRAGANANFEITLAGVAAGTRLVGIYSEDANGRRSVTSTFQVLITSGSTISLADVFLAPTIDIGSRQLQRGQALRVFGQSAPQSEVDVHIFSDEFVTKTITDSAGAYAISFDTKPLAEDDHTTKSRALLAKAVSPFSQTLQFTVGTGGAKCNSRGNVNGDCKVNIVDFSILLFWWNTKVQRGLDIADINKDGKVNIVDFSILLFHWTE